MDEWCVSGFRLGKLWRRAAHCLRYTASQNKEIITINPEIISSVLAKT